MRRPRPLVLLPVALLAALAYSGATVVGAGASPVPAALPSATSSPPPPAPSPTPIPSPSPTPSPAPCVAPPASAPPSDPEGSSTVQGEIEDVAGRIRALVDQNGYPGFTGQIADPDGARLLLCWLSGDPLPSPVAAIVANPGQPITVVREDTPFSYNQLAARVGSIDGNSSLGAQINGSINAVVVPEEGTGLIAEVTPNDPSTFDQAHAQSVLSAAAGVPVTVEVNPAPTGFTRLNDASPWSGGGRLTTGGAMPRPICSSGFGMVIGTTPYLLTALHCGAGPFFNGQLAGANRRRIGAVGPNVVAADSEAIAIDNPNTASRNIYKGGVNDATEGSVRIAAAGVNVRGLFVCTSGSFSGQHCALLVRFINLFLATGQGPFAWAFAPVGGVAAAEGDSGGPVAMREFPGGPVLGMGVISGGFRKFPCAVYDATVCGSDVFYSHLVPLLRAYGGALP